MIKLSRYGTQAFQVSLVLGMILLFGGCSLLTEIQRPTIEGVRPKIKGLDFQGIEMDFDIQVRNPYPIPLVSPNFDYGFKLQDTSLFESARGTEVNIPSQKIGTVTLPMRFQFMDIYRSVKSLAGANEANYELNGTFHFTPWDKAIDLPFSHQGTLPIPKPPKISIKDLNLSEVSLSSAKINVDSVIKNPNIFGIDLRDVGYSLNLGEIEIGGLKTQTAKKIGAGEEGALSLTGEVSALSSIRSLLKGMDPGKASLSPTGSIKTPYGDLSLP